MLENSFGESVLNFCCKYKTILAIFSVKSLFFFAIRDQRLDDKMHATQKPYVRIKKFLHPFIPGNIPETYKTKTNFSKIIHYFSWAIQSRLQ